MTRKVDGLSMISFEGGRYSVPHQLAGQAVWARRHGDDIVIVHATRTGRVSDEGECRCWPLPLWKAGTIVSLPAEC
ncbi:MAG: hypothetical protein DLM62_10990 [Pseudonocardiales bacterium]|nr:MAG: hypothetical protein DLM62_10990 [Pseudonocardiales bacterium]